MNFRMQMQGENKRYRVCSWELQLVEFEPTSKDPQQWDDPPRDLDPHNYDQLHTVGAHKFVALVAATLRFERMTQKHLQVKSEILTFN